MPQLSRAIGAAVLAGAMVAGCSMAGAQPMKAPSQAPSPSASASCLSAFLTGEPGSRTIAELSKIAETILVGVFTRYGTPIWETPDGAKPADYTFTPDAPEVVTPVLIDVDSVVQGTEEAAVHAVVWGGAVGCDHFYASEREPFTLDRGQRYVIFLIATTRAGSLTGYEHVIDAWPIGTHDEVQTWTEGLHPLSQLTRELQNGKADPTPSFDQSGEPGQDMYP